MADWWPGKAAKANWWLLVSLLDRCCSFRDADRNAPWALVQYVLALSPLTCIFCSTHQCHFVAQWRSVGNRHVCRAGVGRRECIGCFLGTEEDTGSLAETQEIVLRARTGQLA